MHGPIIMCVESVGSWLCLFRPCPKCFSLCTFCVVSCSSVTVCKLDLGEISYVFFVPVEYDHNCCGLYLDSKCEQTEYDSNPNKLLEDVDSGNS